MRADLELCATRSRVQSQFCDASLIEYILTSRRASLLGGFTLTISLKIWLLLMSVWSELVDEAVPIITMPREFRDAVLALEENMVMNISVRCRERNESECYEKVRLDLSTRQVRSKADLYFSA